MPGALFFSAIATLVVMAAAQASTERAIHNFNPHRTGRSPPSTLVADASAPVRHGARRRLQSPGALQDVAEFPRQWTQTVLYTSREERWIRTGTS